MKKIKALIKNYQKSPSIVYFMLEHKFIALILIAVFVFSLRSFVGLYTVLNETKPKQVNQEEICQILNKSLPQHQLSLCQSNKTVSASASKKNEFFSKASINKLKNILDELFKSLELTSIILVAVMAILIFFKEFINLQLVRQISNKKHSVIFGFGEFSRALVDNEIRDDITDYIIFDQTIKEIDIEYLRNKGLGVLVSDVFDDKIFEHLNFENMSHAIITLGNDRLNIELATRIIDSYIKQGITTPIKLVIHIVNRDLNILFHQQFLAPSGNNQRIDIQTFSFYEECAVRFFDEYPVDGSSLSIINSKRPYHLAIVGQGKLALNMVYQAALLAHLPNENKLTIHLVDKQALSFRNKIIKHYPSIEKVVKLVALELDPENLDFFQQHKLWYKKDLVHVVVCSDDGEQNLQITTDLFDKTYIQATAESATNKQGALTTQISCAIFNGYTLSQKINENKQSLKQFYTFANVSDICTHNNILEDEHDLIAQLINSGYAQEYAPDDLFDLSKGSVLTKIRNKWYDQARLSDCLSSKAQSKAVDTKLKSLQLKRVPSTKAVKQLLQINRSIFDQQLSDDLLALGLNKDFLNKYSKEIPKLWDEELKNKQAINIYYFPEAYDTLFEKMVRMEHNRWNAFHYLDSWTYNKVKAKVIKQHDCLLPLNEFLTPELQLTVIYDMYAILYVPNYLANAGWEIVPFDA